MNTEDLQKNYYKDLNIEIAKELQELRGKDGLERYWIKLKADKNTEFVDFTNNRYVNKFPDRYRSGGVVGLMMEYLKYSHNVKKSEVDKISIQKDFLFTNKIENKHKKEARLVVMSSFYNKVLEKPIIKSIEDLINEKKLRRSKLKEILLNIKRDLERKWRKRKPIEFIEIPHPVHWLNTNEYKHSLPDIWHKQKIGLIFLPKSTTVVERRVKASELKKIATEIRARGLNPIACIYPDDTSLSWYYKLEEVHNIFDDIVFTGHVYNKMQMIKLLTYIDSSTEIYALESFDDPSGAFSMSSLLSIYRGKYVHTLMPIMEIYLSNTRGGKKTLQRYPDFHKLKRIKLLVKQLQACKNNLEQKRILLSERILDII